jgi:hypothetical protein
MARGTPKETETAKGETSSRSAMGTMTMLGDSVATTDPVVEQIGQMCEADGAEVRSEQKWNCAPRKTIPRSKTQNRVFWVKRAT